MDYYSVDKYTGESHVKKAAEGNFGYGVAPRPEAISLQQGPDIYMFASASANQRTAAFEYMKHLISKESQITWGIETGYIPVRTTALNSDEYKNSPSLVSKIIAEATKEVFKIPVARNTDAVYRQSTILMEKVLSEKNVDLAKELEAFKKLTDGMWIE